MDDITIGVTENVNNISVTAQPNDQIIDIAVTETVETVLLDVSTTVQEVSVTATQNVIVENITVDYVSNENHIDINVTDATQDVTLNVTPTLIEINILRSGGEVNILQFDSLADFPTTGSSDYFYLAKDTNKLYRWTGSAYAEISATANAVWGQIIGTLSEQTDLQNALNLKAPINSPTFTGTVSGITKGMVGLGQVDNTSDLDKPISTATQTALNAKQPLDADLTSIAALSGTYGFLKKTNENSYSIDTNTYLTEITSSDVTDALGFTPENAANKGIANGYASLDGGGKVPSSQLPSYVDDVIEVSSYDTLPTTGETGKIYITLDTNKIYRWTGSVYVEVSSSAAVWGGITGTLSNQTDLQSALDAKQDDLNGTGFVKASGTTISYDNSTYLTTSSAASTYVPYTGATANVDLGTFDLTADVITGATGSFASSGSGNTLSINHSSGSGIALNISKGGNGEGLYINKTSGSGNAATIIGTLNATTLVKSGGTSSQFLKADGSVDSSTYLTSASLSGYVATSGDQTISGTKTFTGFGLFDNTIFIKQDSSVSFLAGYNSIDSDSTGIIFSLPAGNMAKFILTSLTASRDYTLPNASGTIALTSDIPSSAGFVATTGDQSIAGDKTFTGDIINDGDLYIKQDASFAPKTGYVNLFAGAGNSLSYNFGNSNINQTLSFPSNGRVYTFQDATGTLALTSDLHNAVTIGTANGLSLSTQVLSLALASTTSTGALSATDWNTFNNKASSASLANYLPLSGGTISTTSSSDALRVSNGGSGYALYVQSNAYFQGNAAFQSLTANAIVKADGSNNLTSAVAGTDYVVPSALSSYLPLSGGTLTGALSGTTATFTNSLSLDRTGLTAATPIRFTTAGSNDWFIGSSPLGTSTSDLFFYSYGTSSSVFTLSKSTGAATFSSSVTAGQMSIGTTSTSSLLNINGAGYWPTKLITLSGAEPTRYSGNMGLNIVGGSTIAMSFGTRNNNVDYDNTLNIINGNVGIGTTSPIDKVNISGGATFTATIADPSNTSVGSLQIGYDGTKGLIRTWNSSPITLSSYNYQSFDTSGSERMRITSVGHIQTNGNPVYAYSGSISIGGTYQTIFAAVSGGVYLVSVTTDSADGTFGLLTVINDPDKSLGMVYGNNISLQFSGDNVQMKSTNGSTYNTTWTATRLK